MASDPTNPRKNAGPSTKSAFIVDTFQKCAGEIQTTSIVTRLRSNTDTEEQSPDYAQSEYTTP